MGPSFTLIRPRCSSPSLAMSVAPGTQGATRSTSSRTCQASATATGMVRVFSSFTAPPPPSCRVLCRGPDGVDDPLVAGAAAQVPGECLADLLVGGFGVLRQERGHRDDESGGAETALQPVMLRKRSLHLGQFAVRPCKTLDGGHLAAVGLHGEHQAGADGFAVEQHGARAADAVLAAEVGS